MRAVLMVDEMVAMMAGSMVEMLVVLKEKKKAVKTVLLMAHL